MHRRLAQLAVALAALLVAGVVSAAPAPDVGAEPASHWKKLGKGGRIDLPAGFGSFKDVDKHRAGVQVEARLLVNADLHRLRVVADDAVVGEAPDGGFTPQDSLRAGWRFFAVGQDLAGRARVWRPGFDAAGSLVAHDPPLPCRSGAGATAPLAGPFDLVIPAGAVPDGKSLPSSDNSARLPGQRQAPRAWAADRDRRRRRLGEQRRQA